jgi:thiamine-monophosphate kinase
MNTRNGSPSLRDLGERYIVERLIIPRFGHHTGGGFGIGDDCALLPPPPTGSSFVFTIDPCPTPVACLLDTPDLYHYGWLTALINVSDLAAMGAEPAGLLVSTVMPETMTIEEYERFLDGLSDASNEWRCPVIGGNIKDGAEFSATGSAVGTVRRESVLLRTGAVHGDRVIVVGDMGVFWSACLNRLGGLSHLDPAQADQLKRALYRPQAKIREGIALGRSHCVTTCMDSSDGVIGCLLELALRNRCDIIVENDSLKPCPAVAAAAATAGIDVRKLMLSWGDWQLVCTVRPESVNDILELMHSLGTACFDIGEIRQGAGNVYLSERGALREFANLANERFSGTSSSSYGIAEYADLLRRQPLTTQ